MVGPSSLQHSILALNSDNCPRCHGDALDHTEHFPLLLRRRTTRRQRPPKGHQSDQTEKSTKTGWPTSYTMASRSGWRCTAPAASNPAPFLSLSALTGCVTGPLPQRMAESVGWTLDVTSESVAPALPSAVWGEKGAIPCSSDPGSDQPPCFASQAANLSCLCRVLMIPCCWVLRQAKEVTQIYQWFLAY